ncbi:cytochrome P450 93A3-like [Hevea brasiliensis]|uniref:cytochrome P450 93A3-like n=1 Tax=Hevea brasiliensis TaxID=3981 RepID=UPI0025FBB418|nr:cytochrome P450 93A3-like [Hevea brasiliensis]
MPICDLSGTSCGRWGSWMCKDKELPTVLIIASVSILGTCLLVWVSKTARGKAHLPPGPRGFPILGYLPFLGPNLHQLFMELAQNYGPIYKLSIVQKLCVIISSPTLVKEIVRDQDIAFANRNPTIAAKTFSYGGKDIAFAPYGPEWRLLRKIFVREMQSNANLDAFYSLRRSKVKKSVRDVYGKKIGEPVDVGELAFLTAINMISGMFWGGTLGQEGEIDIGAKFRVAVAELVEILGKPNVSDFFPFLARSVHKEEAAAKWRDGGNY